MVIVVLIDDSNCYCKTANQRLIFWLTQLIKHLFQCLNLWRRKQRDQKMLKCRIEGTKNNWKQLTETDHCCVGQRWVVNGYSTWLQKKNSTAVWGDDDDDDDDDHSFQCEPGLEEKHLCVVDLFTLFSTSSDSQNLKKSLIVFVSQINFTFNFSSLCNNFSSALFLISF